jgi:CDGSH-type Zn-finger protein
MNSEMAGQKSSQVEEVSIKVNKGGPYAIRGRVKIIDKDGTETIKEGPFILCRCGESKTKPFCDNSHRDIEFDD